MRGVKFMYCRACGRKLNETLKKCPSCGVINYTQVLSLFSKDKHREASVRNNVISLVERATQGDVSVWEAIYNETYRFVYYIAYKYLHSEHDTQDITQEIYIHVISSIKQLNSALNFYGWLRRIIHTRCINYINRNKTVLMDDNENGVSFVDDIQEINEDFIPDEALDNEETQKMILDLVDALPNNQRQAIIMFYYDEMSIEQIAVLTNCPEGTIKSRLYNARKNIKLGIEKYEMQGVKLYGTVSLPVLSILLKEHAQNLQIPLSIKNGFSTIADQINTILVNKPKSANNNGPTNEFNSTTPDNISRVKIDNPINYKGKYNDSTNPISNISNDVTKKSTRGFSVLLKIALSVLSTVLLICGIIMFFINLNHNDLYLSSKRNIPEQTTLLITEQIVQTSNITSTNESIIYESMNYTEVIDIETRILLSNIINIMKRCDYKSAYNIHEYESLKRFYEQIAFLGEFLYSPDETTRVYIKCDDDGKNYIYLDIFNINSEYAEHQEYYISIMDTSNRVYTLANAYYIDGALNGSANGYNVDFYLEHEEHFTQNVNFTGGEILGDIYEQRDIQNILIKKPIWVEEFLNWPIKPLNNEEITKLASIFYDIPKDNRELSIGPMEKSTSATTHEQKTFTPIITEKKEVKANVKIGNVVTNMEMTIERSSTTATGRYSGDIQNGLADGKGIFEGRTSSGDVWFYEGDFKNGNFCGEGIIISENGYKAEGLFKNNELNGFGKEYRNEAIEYEGLYINGIREGEGGKLYSNNGDLVFEGEFFNGFPEKNEFVKACQEVTYENVQRRPEYYNGRPIKISGIVLQVIDIKNNESDYRISTGARNNEVFYVAYNRVKDEIHILKSDNVVAYGICRGLVTYKSNLGANVTLPGLLAYFMEIVDVVNN